LPLAIGDSPGDGKIDIMQEETQNQSHYKCNPVQMGAERENFFGFLLRKELVPI
jgi:hypothetical protein